MTVHGNPQDLLGPAPPVVIVGLFVIMTTVTYLHMREQDGPTRRVRAPFGFE